MNKLARGNVFLLVLCAAGFCGALTCYDCIIEKNDNGEINDCGDDPDAYPTVTCDAEADGARCVFIENTNATTNWDGKFRTCLKGADTFCDVVYPLPGFNITKCYTCAEDFCNRNEDPPAARIHLNTQAKKEKVHHNSPILKENRYMEGIVFEP